MKENEFIDSWPFFNTLWGVAILSHPEKKQLQNDVNSKFRKLLVNFLEQLN
jgi:hypothetical protein